GVKVTGIDLSREMLDKARARVERRGLTNVEALLEMDAEAMSFPDATFDKVVAMYVISAVPHPDRLLEELHRVCKPDGEILLVNHVSSDNRLVKAVEKGLARFSDKIGFRPDFELRGLVSSPHDVVQLARVNVFWKVMRLRNGVSRRIR